MSTFETTKSIIYTAQQQVFYVKEKKEDALLTTFIYRRWLASTAIGYHIFSTVNGYFVMEITD